MSDPFSEDPSGGIIDRWLKRVPGFGGYADQNARQASDEQARKLVVEALTRAKTVIDQFARALVDAGKIDEIPACDRLRGRIDLLVSRLRGAPAGYSDFFDSTSVTEDAIEDLCDHDLLILDEAEKLANELGAMKGDDETVGTSLPKLGESVEQLHQRVDERTTLLKKAAGVDLID